MISRNRKIEDYIHAHSDQVDSLLEELSRDTWVKIYHPQRISNRNQGQMLGFLTRMIGPERVLEIGTFTGYSGICIARNLSENALLYTIEISDELAEFALSYFRKAGLAEKIRLLTGDALSIIPSIDEMFDLVYIDGNKKEYPAYYRCVFNKLKTGGFIIADNVLWDGKVVQDKTEPGDHFTRGIMDFNDLVQNDPAVENVMISVYDGLMLIRKK